MIRPARNQTQAFRNAVYLIATCCAVALVPPVAAQDTAQTAGQSGGQSSGQTVTLTLDQARAAAEQALKAGDPDIALQIAGGLLQADPNDAFAHFVMAVAFTQKNNLRQGRKAASQAYRYSQNPVRKFESAQLAAQLSFAEGRPTLTQIWMRRAVQHAPNDQIESQIGREYAQVRALNPWSFQIGVGLRPSDNVNNGADTGLNIIDGVPATGILSPDAQALSGVIGTLDITTGYRLRGDGNSTTTWGGRLYIKEVRLSDDARAQAPMASDDDFDSTYAETSLRHDFAIGADGFGSVEAAAGRFWSGGRESYNFGRVSALRGWRLNAQSGITVSGLFESRSRIDPASQDADIYGLGARYFQRLANGDALSFDLTLRDVNSVNINNDFNTTALRAAYSFANPIGPVEVSAGITVGYADYDAFNVGFISVPGGRQDESVLADLTLLFRGIDYAGFAPTMRFQAGKSRSNVSRFDTRELSVSMGIRSKF